MKKIFCACCAIALVSPLTAGDVYTPAPAPAPAPTYESYYWFIGGGADYRFDAEEIYWNGHIGYNLSNASSIFVESGWFGDESDVTLGGVNFDYDVDIVPITLNYQYEWALSDRLSWYLGAGLGAANIDVEVRTVGSEDEWSFMLQGLTGLVYEFTPAFEGYFGGRYMWFDEPDFGGQDLDDFDDWTVGLGIRFNF